MLSAKERGGLGALPLLSERLAAAVAALAFSACRRGLLVLVPVPSTRSASAQRGIDFTSALAVGAARQLRKAGIPVVVWKGLRQIRQRADQAGLGLRERQQNLHQTMRVTRCPPDGWLVIIDDVVTTGSTITEAQRALADARVGVLGAATVAATPKRHRRGRPGQLSPGR